MIIIETVSEMHHQSLDWKRQGKSIGFVPTMGALHEGHISLVNEARKDNAITVVSIFVNPTQFGPQEDFSRYPRTFEEDVEKLKAAGVDCLFFPSVAEMYPVGFETTVLLKNLPNHLCGLSRPGHFDGVAQVVTKLLNITCPDQAYFGEKDFQQAAIIRRMNLDLNLFVKIRTMPIYREADGLAMSSRNRYLSNEERSQAVILSQALTLAEKRIKENLRDGLALKSELKILIEQNAPLAKIDYIELVNPDTLADEPVINKPVLLALAVYFGKTRLIDNRVLKP